MRYRQTNDRRTHRFSRRRFLAASAVTTAGLAGCLGRDEDADSGERDSPDARDDAESPAPVDPDAVPGPGSVVVENPPDAVYVPTHREAFEMLPTQQVGEYAILPHFTYAHTFWLMRGEHREEVEPEPQTLHFMFAFWDAETGTQLPVDVAGEMIVRRGGDVVSGPRVPWPMISQGMGFHFGDNVPFASADHDAPFPEEGTYEIELGLEPIGARTTGAFEGRFDDPVSTTIEFEFTTEDFEAITDGVDFFPEERWGDRGAMSPRDHARDDGHGGHGHGMPAVSLPSATEYPGTHLGTYESHDAEFVVKYIDDSRLAEDGEGYLLVSPRTPYNRVPLPGMALSAEGEIQGPFTQTLDSELGHHYGRSATLSDGDAFELVVESPPQVARHQGYETAFLDMPAMTVEGTSP